jgi:hypothetical protein
MTMKSSAPWNPQRTALLPFLQGIEGQLRAGHVGHALPCDDLDADLRLPLRDMVQRLDVFAAAVEPAVDEIPDHLALAQVLARLIDEIATQPDLVSGIRLYQLIISDWRWHYRTLETLQGLLAAGATFDRSNVYDYFLWLLRTTPDVAPARFALWMLGRTAPAPPLDVIRLFALHELFSAEACRLIASKWVNSEDELIALAKVHSGWGRIHALDCLSSVAKPEHRTWLLREGYKNRVLDAYTDYTAAVHGGLAERLGTSELPLNELIDLGTILDGMTFRGPRGVDLGHYADGPAACRRFIEHCDRQPPDERLFWMVWNLVDFVENPYLTDRAEIDELAATWSEDARHGIANRGRRYLSKADWPDKVIAAWNRRTGRPDVQELDNDLERFHAVLEDSVTPERLQAIAEWARRFLHRDRGAGDASRRRIELEGMVMPGIRSGGIFGLTDPQLASVYGQVVLQVLQALRRTPGIGIDMIRVGLESDIRFHRRAAVEALLEWPDVSAQPDLVDAINAARQKPGEPELLVALDEVLRRLTPRREP